MKTLDTLVELQLENSKKLSEVDSFGSRLKPKLSWLSMPDWASSETSSERRREDSSSVQYDKEGDEIKSLVDNLVADSLNEARTSGDTLGPIHRKIIISSGPIGQLDPLSPQADVSNIMDSMLRQVFADKPAELEQSQPASSGGSLISANIDNLNININPNEEESSKREPDMRELERELPGNAIDSLMSSILESPVRLIPARSQMTETKVFPFSPSSPDSSLLRFILHPAPRDAEFMTPEPKRLFNIDDQMESNERIRIPSSPYEFATGQDMVPPKHKSKMDTDLEALTDEFAKTLAGDFVDKFIMDENRNEASEFNKKKGDNSKDSVFIIKFPQDSEQHNKSLLDEGSNSKADTKDLFRSDDENPFGSILKAIFGPPLEPKLPVPHPTEEKSSHKVKDRHGSHHHGHKEEKPKETSESPSGITIQGKPAGEMFDFLAKTNPLERESTSKLLDDTIISLPQTSGTQNASRVTSK